jgi:hypothetical protein
MQLHINSAFSYNVVAQTREIVVPILPTMLIKFCHIIITRWHHVLVPILWLPASSLVPIHQSTARADVRSKRCRCPCRTVRALSSSQRPC